PRFHDQALGKVSSALQVVVATGRNFLKDELFGGAATEQHGKLVEEFGPRHQIPILGRQLQSIAQRCNTTGNDGNAVHRVGVWRTRRDQGMPGLVVGNDVLLLLAEEAIFLLKTSDNTLDG